MVIRTYAFYGINNVRQRRTKVVSWEFERRRYTDSCRSKVKVYGMQVVSRLHEHTHAPDAAQLQVAIIYQIGKRKAKETDVTLTLTFYGI
jgi:hypothetical protein